VLRRPIETTPVPTLIRTFIEDSRDGAWPRKKTVLPVRAIVIDKLGEVVHYPRTKNQGVSARLRLGRPEKVGKMPKSLWIVLLLVAIGAPAAHADSVTFTVLVGGAPAPTALDVTFPSPTLDITWQGVAFVLTLPSSSLSTDSYIWDSNETCTPSCTAKIDVLDQTNFSFTSSSSPAVPLSFSTGAGDLTFTPVTTAPEPSPVALMLLGVGLVFVMRKRIGHDLPQAN